MTRISFFMTFDQAKQAMGKVWGKEKEEGRSGTDFTLSAGPDPDQVFVSLRRFEALQLVMNALDEIGVPYPEVYKKIKY